MYLSRYLSFIVLLLAALPTLGLSQQSGAAYDPQLVAESRYDVARLDSQWQAFVAERQQARWQDMNRPERYRAAAGNLPQYAPSVYARRLKELGYAVPMDYNPIVQNFIELYVNRRRSLISRALGEQHVYFPIIEQVFDREGIPLELKYLALIESAFVPRAVSHANAHGLWQFMHYTAKPYGAHMDSFIDDRWDPYLATEMAAAHLKDLHAELGDWLLVIAAYNCGLGRVKRSIRYAGGSKDVWAIYRYLPRETRGYVPSFIAAAYAMNYYAEHNIRPLQTSFTYDVDTLHVTNKPLYFAQIYDRTGCDLVYLQELNPGVKRGLVPAGERPFVVRLPRAAAEYATHARDSLFIQPSDSVIAQANKILFGTDGRASVIYHRVRSGENLGSIARRYRVYVSHLMAWNGKSNSRIYAGERLRIHVKPLGTPMGNPDAFREDNPVTGITTVASSQTNVRPASQVSTIQSTRSSAVTGQQGTYLKQEISYTVRRGENLWSIARKFPGISAQNIMHYNKMGADSDIRPGMRIKIPPVHRYR